MKKLNAREVRLSLITGGVILLGLSYQILNSQLTRLKGLKRQELSARVERRQQQDLLAEKPDLIEQLSTIKGQLPRHPEGQDLKSELARQVQSLANKSGLRLTGLTPDAEVFLEELELYQAAVECSWSGSSKSLVAFLHQLNELGAVADIRDLRLRNRSGMANTLSGTFVLDFVYSRVPPAEIHTGIDSLPEPVDNPPAP
ncbi:hypothetical protein P0Y35_16055 [Kiritimatiellaeota bacterium B1221]|nr:hypothetical protein [Kiritimatiellaeota bacterium B1221]